MDGTPTQLIKDKLNVVDVLKEHIQLQPAGRNFKALCPFHHEKSPSFMVSPERNTWHCFGCGEGGDIFTFIMKFENVEFGEALKILAEKAGVELRRVSPMEYKQLGLLYDLNSAARDFYRKQYAAVATAQEYIKSRGLKSDTVEEFEIGWAPQSTDELSRHLVNLGYAPEDVIRAGLALKSDRGLMFDRFRGRIMFPIWNHSGKTVGFTGRILPQFDTGEMGKYVNSPETPIFQKSKLLYGFQRAKNAIRDAGAAFLVEGQMDMIMTWQAGVKNVVATSGTALTAEHLHSIRRLTENLVLSFDNDSAGYTALERAIDLAEAMDFGVKVAVVEGFKDAAEAVQKNPGYMAELIKEAKPAPQYYFDRYLPKGVGDLRDREYLLKLRRVAQKLMHISSPVERSAWLKQLSSLTGMAETALVEEAANAELGAGDSQKKEEIAKEQFHRNLSRRALLTERLLAMVAATNDFTAGKDVVIYFPEPYPEVWAILESGGRKSPKPELDTIINTALLVPEELDPRELEDIKRHLRREYLKERRQALSLEVKQAEYAKDETRLAEALKKLSELPGA